MKERQDCVQGDLPWGGEHTIQYTDDVLYNRTPETYIILLTDVTPTNSYKKFFLKDFQKVCVFNLVLLCSPEVPFIFRLSILTVLMIFQLRVSRPGSFLSFRPTYNKGARQAHLSVFLTRQPQHLNQHL